MWLKNLNVLNFKNYREAGVLLSPHVNAFSGPNGSGKTNLLDAIHYLSLCKSYFNPIDSQQILSGEDWFMVQGEFERDGIVDSISCSLKRNQKKVFRKNKKDYNRLADHIGLYPLVMISPYDTALVLDGSEERRKFMDNVISQMDIAYLDRLILYNKALTQRNTLLKQAGRQGQLDQGLMEVLNWQLADYGTLIYEQRKQFMEQFIPEFARHYHFLSSDAEEVTLTYSSQLSTHSFADLLAQSYDKDRILERTTAGIHKDELHFTIHEGLPLKKFGSQGQQKSFLIALKLAQYTYLYKHKGFKPLLLLDDIFDKLDAIRVEKLMRMVSQDEFGQIFITDTDETRIRDIFQEISVELKLFSVSQGSVNCND